MILLTNGLFKKIPFFPVTGWVLIKGWMCDTGALLSTPRHESSESDRRKSERSVSLPSAFQTCEIIMHTPPGWLRKWCLRELRARLESWKTWCQGVEARGIRRSAAENHWFFKQKCGLIRQGPSVCSRCEAQGDYVEIEGFDRCEVYQNDGQTPRRISSHVLKDLLAEHYHASLCHQESQFVLSFVIQLGQLHASDLCPKFWNFSSDEQRVPLR